ncbi:aminopeptidase N [Citricoccus sp. K5]|uniref:aminopeptidase N n=1 Tax=Citricoccus sp. K5 TaxID=2653135 RepID=UPI0012F0A372|nr:aminopeptidase N [Citricoccus sp. K5]VXB36020.1 Aminopeptidase N [Citricoccus sp. K5]
MVTDNTLDAPVADALPTFLDRTNLTRDEAFARSHQVITREYDVHIDLSTALDPSASGYRSTTTLTFSCVNPGTWTFLDFINDGVESVVLNGRTLDPTRVAGRARILLEDLAAENEVTVIGTALYSTSGEGLHRFVDPADGQTYLYTQYEPADARRVFANFEQPDLKARFTFHLTGPGHWVLASNQPETSRQSVVGAADSVAGGAAVGVAPARNLVTVDFAPTPPLSTYLTTLLAGPYATWADRWAGHPASGAPEVPLALYCRSSMAASLDAERLFATTRAGLDFFHDLFGAPYLWGKYGQAFVPEYNLGAMENPGLVTFTEDYVFTSQATAAQYEARATTILHEMAHMWFGDLVTMRWWDDLWLKESFADYMGTLAVAEATEFTGAWTTFANRRKGWAYVQDQYPTTHPIVADITDLEAARQNFDGITYAKGASVLKQLVAFVGRDAFMAASRLYFARHAWGNASLADFVDALAETSGRDLKEWVDTWLHTRGVPELSAEDGHLHHRGTDPVTGAEVLRPHVLKVGRYSPDDVGRLVRTGSVDVEVRSGPAGTSTRVVLPASGDSEAVQLILPNDEDLTYAKIKLDEASLHAVLRYPVENDLACATVWAALWNMTRDAILPAAQFVDAVCRLSGLMADAGLYGRVLEQALSAVSRYVPLPDRPAVRSRLGAALADALQTTGAGSDRQRSAVRTLARLVRGARDEGTAAAEEHLVAVLQALVASGPEAARDRAVVAPGLDVDAEVRWAAWQGLTALGLAAQDDLDAALQADVTAANAVRHRMASAAIPEAPVRQAAWEAVMTGRAADGQTLSNDHLSATAAGFTASRPDLAAPFTGRFWPELEAIWSSRSNGLASRTIIGLFPSAQDALPGAPDDQWRHPVVLAANDWLQAHPDSPRALRRLVIEKTDDVLRALRAQAASRP